MKAFGGFEHEPDHAVIAVGIFEVERMDTKK